MKSGYYLIEHGKNQLGVVEVVDGKLEKFAGEFESNDFGCELASTNSHLDLIPKSGYAVKVIGEQEANSWKGTDDFFRKARAFSSRSSVIELTIGGSVCSFI